MLIILSGRSGVGKTTIGRELALRLAAVYIRIDSIETALGHDAEPDIYDDDARLTRLDSFAESLSGMAGVVACWSSCSSASLEMWGSKGRPILPPFRERD